MRVRALKMGTWVRVSLTDGPITASAMITPEEASQLAAQLLDVGIEALETRLRREEMAKGGTS